MTDFPKLKYIEESGRMIPIVEPQHFTGVGDEVVRTGVENPLPTKDTTVTQAINSLKSIIEAQTSSVVVDNFPTIQSVKDDLVLAKLTAMENEIKATNLKIQATNEKLGGTLNTQLTGSIVEIDKATNVTVPAGSFTSTAIPDQKINVSKIFTYISTKDTTHKYRLYLVPRHKFSDGSYGDAGKQLTIEEPNGKVINSGVRDVISPYYRVAMQNQDDVAHVYDFVLGGFM